MKLLEPACAWQAVEMEDESLWTERFDAAELDELDHALRVALSRSPDVLDIGRDDFPLPGLAARLGRVERALIDGRGFVRLRGLRPDRYDVAEMEMIYWGIGLYLGNPWPQNKHGHVLGDVMDQGKAATDPTARGNELGGMALPFHSDGADLVGLMCLDSGLSGGLSLVANAVTIHNRLVTEAPDLARSLYCSLPYDYRGEQAAGGRPWYALPVFTEWDDRLFVRCIPPYILASQRHEGAPRLTSEQQHALKQVVDWANDPAFHIQMRLEPGDIQFVNNFHLMHGRTAYRDDREKGRIRHLKRLWLETSVLTDRPPHFQNAAQSHWNAKRTASRIRT